MTNSEIKEIQQALQNFKLYKGKVDGIYGNKTQLAVRQFQKLNGLVPDGICGNKTKNELFPTIENRYKASIKNELISKFTGNSYPRESNCKDFFGEVGKNQTKITLPYPMRLAWNERQSIKKMICHKKVAKDLQGIFKKTLDYYGIDGIEALGLDMYGGCFNVRKIRGGDRYSTHSWGVGVDIDPASNRLKWGADRAKLNLPRYDKFWEIVEFCGGYSLGKNHGYDFMHFQFCYR
jgi:peptidoglycan hydrolase-like protein with peptidoglycan-binding domain